MQSETLQSVYDFAIMFAHEKKCNELLSQHILLGLATKENEARHFLAEFGITANKIIPRQTGAGGRFVISNEVNSLQLRADMLAEQLGDDQTNCTHMLLAILSLKDTYAYDKIAFFLRGEGKTMEQFFAHIVDSLPNKKRLVNWVNQPDGAIGSAPTASMPTDSTLNVAPPQPQLTSNSFVRADVAEETANFGIDLTQKALDGGIDPVIGRDVETERVIQTLTRRTKNNPVLVGEPGVGKTSVVEGLALAMAQGHVPVELQGKRLVQLDMATMVAGTRFRGDFEERLTRLVKQVIEAGDVILFIDEIHNLVGAGGTSDGTMDAAEILKPALARGQLRVIGATTTREYRQYIEKDPALERRFQPILVDEPTPELAVKIVQGVKSKYEKHHGVQITDDAIETAVQLSVRYITDRFLPDKALDIIDEACSKLKISTFAVPPHLVELVSALKQTKREMDLAAKQGNVALANSLRAKYDKLHYEYDFEQTDYQAQLSEYTCVLTPNDVRVVVSQMTGVPVAELSREERDKLVHLEEELSKRVIGQNQAVSVVARAVRRQRAGLKDPNRPIGSFIFVGPTGVGKTELAKALSDCLFGANSDVIRIDMSEYMDKQSTAKLIGAPPGYVGYDEGGYLTDKVQRRPYSVVLFDEIEKAHPDVFNLLLQILDEGRLTNSHGKTIDFRNTVLILTSNIGVSGVSTNGIGFGATNAAANMNSNIQQALKKFFRPEFLNRLDEIVVFNHLDEQQTEQIAELLCYNLFKRLRGTLNVRFTQQAIAFLAKRGYDKEFGARPLKRVIQREIEDALAEKLLLGEIVKGDTIAVTVVGDQIAFVKQ